MCLNGEDRLSELPDCVIHKILSLLETKYAVQTCVLSKRFKKMWTCVHVLRFNDKFFLRGNVTKRFCRFVAETLQRRNLSFELDGIILSAECPITFELITEIFRYASIYNVQYLNIHYSACKLPSSFYTNKSVKILKFRSWIWGDDFFLGPLCLPSLETLILNFGAYRNDKQLNLFKGCPKLKNLKFICYEIKNLFIISGPELTNLTLEVDSEVFESCVVYLDAPKLCCFTYKGPGPIKIQRRKSCPPPQSVYIDLNQTSYMFEGMNSSRDLSFLDNVLTMLRGLDGAKSMTLSSNYGSLLRTLPGYLADKDVSNVIIQEFTSQMRR